VLFDKIASVYVLFGKYINILAFEMASPGNRHCANCIGTLPFPLKPRVREEREWGYWGPFRKQRLKDPTG